jgi:nucleoside-diphosphate-sugar epimerase
VEAIIKLALDREVVREIVNIGPDSGEITIENLADIIAEETGMSNDHVFIDPRPQEVFHATCSFHI